MTTPSPVALKVPRRPLFVGSYISVPVDIDPAAGLSFDDLRFEVPDGPKGGQISLSRERGNSARRPSMLLLAGYSPGRYLLQAFERASGALLAEATFTVTDIWRQQKVGPRLWFSGINRQRPVGAAWGGGPAGPQNINTIPAIGTRRIAVLLVDTSSQRFTSNAADLQGHRDRWMNELINGVTQGGVTRSARAFFQEISFGNFDITAQVFGPVQLGGSWDDYFESDGAPKGSYYQSCFTAGDGLIDYTQFDTLLCVSQSVDATATTSAKRAWPYASIGEWGPFTSSDGNLTYGVSSMPNEWGTGDDREIFETFSHELGHNLGMGDQYQPAVAGRNIGGWDLMHADDPLPHLSLAHRMMLGWINPAWLQTFNFANLGAPVDQTITLNPIAQGAPPAPRRSGIEVRITDGLNYYFEYRVGQNANIGDRQLPLDSRVLGTDVASPPYTAPFTRPGILLLPNDADGDGSVLANGQDYEETDFTSAGFPADFRVDIAGVDGTKADVRVRYGVIGKPDPSIRPWPASADRQWQSPDIEVRNARNQVDPTWFNVPWVGNANTVVARVKNSGTIDAPGVRVNFFVKNYNIGGAPEAFIGSDVRTIAAGATEEFTAPWTPPSQGHFCVVVRIPLYSLPGGAAVEMTELNNLAQSNYDRFISATASPATREVTSVEVGNPYDKATRIFVVGGQSNPLYRTYIDTTWLWLEPGETRQVRVMYEYTIDPKRDDLTAEQRRDLQEFGRRANTVGLMAFIEDPHDTPRHSLQHLGGAEAEVVTGRATQFEQFRIEGERATGRIVMVDDSQPVPEGNVIVRVAFGRGANQRLEYVAAPVQDGMFFATIPPAGWVNARCYYVPAPGYSDSTSRPITRRGE
jgi:M6 family metalloprotease-like protein